MALEAGTRLAARDHRAVRTVGLWLAALGALLGTAAMGYFWWYLSSSLNDSVWPFPGLYLLEATLLCIGVFVFVVIERRSGRSSLGMASYFFVGALSALVVLGAFSIGGALIPALLTLAIAVPLSGLGTPRRPLGSLLALVLGMAVQVALMLLVLALAASRRWSW